MSKNGIRINATSDDPQMIMPFDIKHMGRKYNAMVELTVPTDTQLLLFYLPPGVTDFSVENSVFRKVKKGFNKLYFHLLGMGLHGVIRLDPGSIAGEYLLHSFVIKERPRKASDYNGRRSNLMN